MRIYIWDAFRERILFPFHMQSMISASLLVLYDGHPLIGLERGGKYGCFRVRDSSLRDRL